MNTNELQTTLNDLLRSRSDSNPAFNALVHDYAKFHAVSAVLCGLATVGLVLLSLFSWRRFRRTSKTGMRRSTFERRTFLAFALSSGGVALLMAVIVAANVSATLDPRHGLSTAIPVLGSPRPETDKAQVQQATNAWLKSGRSELPPLLQDKIDDRLSWQRPKAIISGLLLVAFVVFCIRIWSRLIARANVRGARRTLRDRAAIASGGFGAACTLVLMAMVVGNTQATLAPIFLTMLYG